MIAKFYFIISLLSLCACREQIKNKAGNECVQIMQEIAEYGLTSNNLKTITAQKPENIIPDLINAIDTDKTVFLTGLINPLSSSIEPYYFNNQQGIIYAYIIEYLLSNPELTVSASPIDSINYYRVYNKNVIVKKEKNSAFIPVSLSHQDMVSIKKIYTKWWKENKEKSINLLRKEYNHNGSPLEGSSYMWI